MHVHMFTLLLFLSKSLSLNVSQARCPVSSVFLREPKVVRVVRGRLGNQFWGFALALVIERHFQVQPLIRRETRDALANLFPNTVDRFEVVEETETSFNDYYKMFLSQVDSSALSFYSSKMGRAVSLPRSEIDGRLEVPASLAALYPLNTHELIDDPSFASHLHSQLKTTGNMWRMYNGPWVGLNTLKKMGLFHIYPGNMPPVRQYEDPKHLEPLLLHHFQLRKDLLSEAQRLLSAISKQHINRHSTKGGQRKSGKRKRAKDDKRPVVFVGVHARRTDHIEYEARHGLRHLTPSYFIEAMHKFRDNLANASLAFIFVSDDMQWGKEALLPRIKERDLYMVGNGSLSHTGLDLALLSLCNHTIASHGTFSHLASFLAGGVKIIPEHFPTFRSMPVKPIMDENPFQKPLPRLMFLEDYYV